MSETNKTIYRLEEAANVIQVKNFVIIVQSKKIADLYVECGFENTVAIAGQVLPAQVEQILYYTNNVIMHMVEDKNVCDASSDSDIITLFSSFGANAIVYTLDNLMTECVDAAVRKSSKTLFTHNYYTNNNENYRFLPGDILTHENEIGEVNQYQYLQPILVAESNYSEVPSGFPLRSIGKSGHLIPSWANPKWLRPYDGYKGNAHYIKLKAISDYLSDKIDEEELLTIVGSEIFNDAKKQ